MVGSIEQDRGQALVSVGDGFIGTNLAYRLLESGDSRQSSEGEPRVASNSEAV